MTATLHPSSTLNQAARGALALGFSCLLLSSSAAWAQIKTVHTHDGLDRLTQTTLPDGSNVQQTYSKAGNILSIQRKRAQEDPTLVGWWRFDDCTATDSSGYGGHGSVDQRLLCVDGLNGKAIRFDGSGGLIEIPSSIHLKLESTVTLSILANVDVANVNGAGLLQKGESGVDWDYGLTLYSDSPAYRSSRTDWVAQDKPSFAGAYHLFTAVVDESHPDQPVKLYVDGVLLPGAVKSISGDDPKDEPFRSGLVTATELSLVLGVGHPGVTLKGQIDDVKIFNRPLSAAQVRALAAEFGLSPGQ